MRVILGMLAPLFPRETHVSGLVTVRDGYHKAIVGMHMVYFRRTNDTTIVVVRILHQSMDVERHLPADMNKQ